MFSKLSECINLKLLSHLNIDVCVSVHRKSNHVLFPPSEAFSLLGITFNYNLLACRELSNGNSSLLNYSKNAKNGFLFKMNFYSLFEDVIKPFLPNSYKPNIARFILYRYFECANYKKKIDKLLGIFSKIQSLKIKNGLGYRFELTIKPHNVVDVVSGMHRFIQLPGVIKVIKKGDFFKRLHEVTDLINIRIGSGDLNSLYNNMWMEIFYFRRFLRGDLNFHVIPVELRLTLKNNLDIDNLSERPNFDNMFAYTKIFDFQRKT